MEGLFQLPRYYLILLVTLACMLPTASVTPKPTNKRESRKPQPRSRRPVTVIDIDGASTPKPTNKRESRKPQPAPIPVIDEAPASPTAPTPAQPINRNCFSTELYNAIDADIELLSSTFANLFERAHFLGGIVRLAAHDFMDYDRRSTSPYGSDGCFDTEHISNAGLAEDTWCDSCPFKALYDSKYSQLSKADFWIAAAHAVIKQTSVDNALDLRHTFKWGRRDLRSCPGSGERVPIPSGCDESEGTFIDRMGLEWVDVTALLGAHTIGKGDADFSGHDGTWNSNAQDALIFDNTYYNSILEKAWTPRIPRPGIQDFTLDRTDRNTPEMMLNTDICLVYDLEERNNICCTKRGECRDGSIPTCLRYDRGHPRRSAASAVNRFAGSRTAFYEAFASAWGKAIELGWDGLKSLDDC